VSNEIGDNVVGDLVWYIEQTPELVGVVDDTSNVVYLNDAARKRLGVGEASDLTTAHVFPPHAFARYYNEIRPALLRAGTWTGELPVLTASGDAVPMMLTVVARVGPGGQVNGLITLGRESPGTGPLDGGTGRPFAHDELTGLPQRSILDDRMAVALARARRYGTGIAVVLVDVDGLKDVNDTFGHPVGDEVLRTLARRLSQVVRAADTVARVGGDEFIVLLDGLTGADAAVTLTHRIRNALSKAPIDTPSGPLAVTASMGVATGDGRDDPCDLVRRADTAMYRAKAMGGGHVAAFDEDAEVAVATLADEFAVAVSHGLIRPHVQRVIDLGTGERVGFQGLARWDHAERGLLEAASFIDLVSDTPMAPVVDLAVMRHAAAVAARLARRGDNVRVYGHLSRRLLGDENLAFYLNEISNDLSLDPSQLCVEVAHPLVARGSRAIANAMGLLREAGVRTVLSDVQGECDANDLVQNGFDEVRLSRRLVLETAADPHQRIAHATVALAHALDLPVIAVGVETERERDAMLDAGCDYAQGLLYGEIVPAGLAE
jgi:diguanylate cyclase (GGDEF)-like protein